MLDIVRIVFDRLPGLPPSPALRSDSDALHPLRNGPPAIPAGESLIERPPGAAPDPDTGQQPAQPQPEANGQAGGEAAQGDSGGGESRPLLDGAAGAAASPQMPEGAAAPPAPASPLQLPRPDSTSWNTAGERRLARRHRFCFGQRTTKAIVTAAC